MWTSTHYLYSNHQQIQPSTLVTDCDRVVREGTCPSCHLEECGGDTPNRTHPQHSKGRHPVVYGNTIHWTPRQFPLKALLSCGGGGRGKNQVPPYALRHQRGHERKLEGELWYWVKFMAGKISLIGEGHTGGKSNMHLTSQAGTD